MKKILLLFLLVPFFSKAQNPEWDSIYKRISIQVNPLLMASPMYGFYPNVFVEYPIGKLHSLEFGVEANKISQTARVGFLYFLIDGFYVNPEVFVRHAYFANRTYSWNASATEPSVILETQQSGFGDASEDESYVNMANETKFVFAVELLTGKKWLIAHCIPFEIYTGLGFREKVRKEQIYYEARYEFHGLDNEQYFSPPISKEINTFLPTLHFGFRLGFSIKAKKKK